jgi:hypothetical protein
MGRSSRRTGKPSTRGWAPKAKAPSLGEEGNKGTQCTRKLYTGGYLWNWRNGNRRFMVTPWRMITGAEPYTMKVVRAVLNGGREETYSNATRLAPTQLPRFRFQQQVSASVRLQSSKGM